MINSLYICGCSFAYGQELSEPIRNQKNFAGLVGAHYNIPVFNNSKPAGSNQRIIRKTFVELPKLLDQNPLVIIPWTQYHRREVFDVLKNAYRNINVPGPNATPEKFDILYYTNYSTDNEDAIYTILAKLSMQGFLKMLGVPYLFIEAFDDVPTLPKNYLHLDDLLDKQYILPTNFGNLYKGCTMAPGGHPLEEGHQLIADYLIANIDHIHKEKL